MSFLAILEKSLGEFSYNLSDRQNISRQFIRSLYVSTEIKKGELISDMNIKSVRPGHGLHPKLYEEVIGKRAKRPLGIGDRLKLEDIE